MKKSFAFKFKMCILRKVRIVKWFYRLTQHNTTKGKQHMSKELIVAAGIAALAQAQADAFGSCYDSSFAEGVASVPPSTGTFQQSDIDNAVASAKAADAEVLAATQADDVAAQTVAVTALQGQLDSTNAALVAMTEKDAMDRAAMLKLKSSIAGIQAALDSLLAITN